MRTPIVLVALAALGPAALLSRGAPTSPEIRGQAAPSEPGQAAFAALAEIVAILDADPSTDWSRVSLERLRQHLVDMDDVVIRSTVREEPVEGGVALEVTGTGRTAEAIRRMLPAHAAELDRDPAYRAAASDIPGGTRLTVTAESPLDRRAVDRIRALGLPGLLVLGSHHQPHHLAMARGLMDHTHHHD